MNVVIIGNSGSGKTWLARKLSETSATPLIHLDDIFWEPGGFNQKRQPEVVTALIEESLAKSPWIVEGVFGELAARYLPHAHVLIWLDMEWAYCQRRLRARGSESALHMGREQSQEATAKLIEWASAYPTRSDARSYQGHKALCEGFAGQRFRLTSEDEVNRFVLPNLKNVPS